MSEKATTKDLKRVLGRKELLFIACGHVIGSGVFTLMGVAIAMTGKSASLAMMLAAIFVIAKDLPLIICSGTLRLRGGFYSQLAVLWSEKMSGFYIIINMITSIGLGMYSLSVAQYLQGIFPEIPIRITAILVLTIFYVTNLLGIEEAAKVQKVMVLIMAVAMTLFIVYGVPQVKPGYFSGPDFITDGPFGVMATAALLTWATSGASDIIQLSGEAKDPTKDCPFVTIVVTIAVSIFYGVMAIVASGVLPVPTVAGQPLTLVAAEIFPRPLFIFFVIGGAVLALATTLNAAFAFDTRPVLQSCVDGWFPIKLGAINRRFRTPHILLTIFYGIGIFSLITGFDIERIADLSLILNNLMFVFISYCVVNLPKRVPEIWEKSRFHMGKTALQAIAVVGALSSILQIILLVPDTTPADLIGNVIILIIGVIYIHFRSRSGKVEMEISYEED